MISKTCGYAIRGMVLLSLEQNQEKKIGIQEIAEELSVPQHFMGKILQDLSKRGLIGSIKGPHGGFYCNNHTQELQLIEVIEAVDGLGILKKCFLGRDECSAINPCPMHDDFDGCRTAIFKVFASKTIADLVSSVDLGESVLIG
ncbi:MAG: Rrf2 family transcriptional regulator [Cytophagaceae bacterium]|nr:Rrf2 family transcriptional regulator [Cytophagaceae bacterium]